VSIRSRFAARDSSRRPKPAPRPAKDVATQFAVDALVVGQQSTLDQLAILRQTRGQREVGKVIIPVHLRVPISLDDGGVQAKATRMGGDE
jgi:hypothetical protein